MIFKWHKKRQFVNEHNVDGKGDVAMAFKNGRRHGVLYPCWLHVGGWAMNCFAFKAPKVRSKNIGGDLNIAFSHRTVSEMPDCRFCKL